MNTRNYILLSILAATAASCSEEIPVVNLGIDDSYIIERMTKLPLHPALTGESYCWRVDGQQVSTDRNYIFMAADEGTYQLSFEIIDPENPMQFDFTVRVVHEEVEFSPYISKVYEYCPAPGQFINTMPEYSEGDTYADMVRKAQESISGTNDVLVSLGGFGGYITFGFDHTIINTPGEKDFRIWGNSFYELGNTDSDTKGGSAEPGIVMVSLDTNCNGLPDDPWYELAGSEYHNPLTVHNYVITYHQPDPNREIVKDRTGALTDLYYIAWTDSEGQSGYVAKNKFHDQDYFPKWLDSSTLTFSGTCLPPNATDRSNGRGTNFFLAAYPYGYADNHPNDEADLCSFDIAWAVDAAGQPVALPGIDFVRVYTGLNQYCGWIGETSTEITRAADLHIQ